MAFFVEGGFPMVFILVFGGVALASAARFALHPVPGAAAAIVAYGVAVACAALAGFAVDLSTVGHYVAQDEIEAAEMARILVQGVAEATAPLTFGFAVIAVVALLTAIGLRRLPEA